MIKFIEQWGTGTNRMIEACLKHGLPEPKFEEAAGSLVVTFRKYRISEEELEKLNDRQRKAIEYLRERGRITNREYVNLFQGAISGDTALNDLRDMVKKGLISIRKKGRSSYYIIR